MSTYHDSGRSIAAWLEAEAPDHAPTRLIEASRAGIRTTPQRTPWWPARRVSRRTTFARLAVAAAAVVVAAFGIIGLTQLNGPVVGPAGPSPSPTPQPSVNATRLDSRVTETEVTTLIEHWLAARIAGTGAEGMVQTEDDRGDGRCDGRFDVMCRIDEVPLLYATSSGAPYQRYEIERVSQPRGPDVAMEFKVRLFADSGATVVEQPITLTDTQALDGGAGLEFRSTVTEMTENGRPVAVPFTFFDGELTAPAARPWVASHQAFNDGLSLNDMYGAERITFVPDPHLVTAPCKAVPAPIDAAALAESIRSNPTFEATAPVNVIVGRAEGLYLDVTLAPGANVCTDEDGRSQLVASWRPYPYFGAGWPKGIDPGSRTRLYLIDMPEGFSMKMLAIALDARQPTFENVVEAAAPVIDSIEFHAP